MTQNCPHCGAKLPANGDAFCPECRNSLDEPPVDPAARQSEENRPSHAISAIAGAEDMSWDELLDEIERGGRLVIYRYCISIGILTFFRPSKIHLVRGGESALAKGWGYTFLSLIVGWWGFPWGFIYTPAAIGKNLCGGEDVTAAVVERFQREGRAE
jgi:hypothetical protein